MRCCVIGCGAPQKGVSIFRLIRKGKFREDWVQAIEEFNGQIINRNSASKQISICETHFEDSYLRSFGNKRYLIHNAVPTIFPKKKLICKPPIVRIKKKRQHVCYVPQCRKFQVPGITMHRIPSKVLRNPKEVLRWRAVLKIRTPFPTHFVLCSRHFEKNQIIYPKPKSSRARKGQGFLVESAFPTLNLPKPPKSIHLAKEIIAKYQRLNERRAELCMHEENYQEKYKSIDLTQPDETESPDAVETIGIETTEPIVPNGFQFIALGMETQKNKLNESIRASLNEFETIHLNNIPFRLDTDSKLKIMTGIPARKILEDIISKCIDYIESHADMKAVPASLENKIILTMYRLRNNVSNAHIAIMFNISTETSKIIFTNCIKLLSKALKCVIRWPTRDDCKKNLPKCFTEFANCVTVLHCRELKIIHPICVTCGSTSCSHIRGPKSVKILIGISPSGLVNYISPSALGIFTKKVTFNMTVLMQILGPCDAVMVDKGLIIGKDLFKTHGVELIFPEENNPKAAHRNRLIASAQAHIEYRMSVVNSFKILSEKLPIPLLPLIDDIIMTICATSNMSISNES